MKNTMEDVLNHIDKRISFARDMLWRAKPEYILYWEATIAELSLIKMRIKEKEGEELC